MEHEPDNIADSGEFMRARAIRDLEHASDAPLGDALWPLVRELDLSFAHSLVGDSEIAWLNDPARRLDSLQSLNLRHTSVTHAGIDMLTWPGRNLCRLLRLNLSDQVLCDRGAQELGWPNGGMPLLRTLTARHTSLSPDGLSNLLGPKTSLRQLGALDVADNPALGPEGFAQLCRSGTGTPLLGLLCLDRCNLTDGTVADLGHADDLFPSLTWLLLAGNAIDEAHALWFATIGGRSCPRLRILDLSDTGPFQLLFVGIAEDGCMWDDLRMLSLRGTGLTDEALTPLEQPSVLPNLEHLDARRNRLTPRIVARLKAARPNLTIQTRDLP